jgi:hypothetical protein
MAVLIWWAGHSPPNCSGPCPPYPVLQNASSSTAVSLAPWLRKRLAKAEDDKIDVDHVDIPITVCVRHGALRDGTGVRP